MQLKSLKLKNDCDLLCFVIEESAQFLTISQPIQVNVEPRMGFYARDWLFLTDEKVVQIDKNDIFFVKNASNRSIEIYDEFREQQDVEKQVDEFEHDELSDVFESLLESKRSIKH